ncbi:ATP-binding cassette domain-containing protein [Halorussus ruber]|uniref:ATP-binding cassette domain-containing protein n=1 Tax=Halorussus ruber TaxID=1126238 RepID=UPI001092250A|nr:ABC transporter ATP-binding protein [Halorussus ruber]
MKVNKIHSREFAKDEYGGFEHTNIEGENLLIQGGNRTGKTLTFNAVLYNLLGAQETIDLSTGRNNNVSLEFTDGAEFRRGKLGARFRKDDIEKSEDEAQEELADWLANDLSSEVSSTDIIKNHFVHTHIERMPLSRLSEDARLNHVRSAVNQDTQESIEETEEEISQLEERITEIKASLRRKKEDKRERENNLRSNENQLEKYQKVKSLAESGKLEDIIKTIESDEELQETLSELSKRQDFLQRKQRSRQKDKRQWERYRESERNEIIAEAVNDFVCPACSGHVDTELAKNRIGSRCPFCAVDGRSDDIKADVDEKISHSEEELEEIEGELEEIASELEEVDKEIAKIHEERPELGDIDGRIERVIRNNGYDLSSILEETEKQLERYQSSIDEAEEEIAERETEIEELEDELNSSQERLEEAKDEVAEMRDESINAEINEFSEEWQEVFEEIAGEIGLEIQITQDGDIEIPGSEGPRKYDRAGDLSDAEITFMNISFAVAYNRFVREAEATEWSTIVCDEPFSNLDAEGRENLLEFIQSSDLQFICTSSNEEMLEEFPKTGQLTRQRIQASLGRYT